MDNSPIFIIGSPRSGTTLLRFVISSHPRIYIPEETGFIPFLVHRNKLNEPLSKGEMIRVLERIADLNYLWQDAVSCADQIPVTGGKYRLADILDTLYRQKIKPYGSVRWGDKTPLYVRYMDTIMDLFPDAKFIHLIRDGRDATLSAQRKWGLKQHFYMDDYYLLRNWVTNVTTGRKAGAVIDDRQYLEVFYEKFVKSPEDETIRICDFLSESYEPEMLQHSLLANQIGPGPNQHTEVLKPISTSSLYRWKTEMDLFTRKMADRVAGKLLTDLGYEKEELPDFTLAEIIRFRYLQIKYLLLTFIRNLLYKTGIFSLNRNMRVQSEGKGKN